MVPSVLTVGVCLGENRQEGVVLMDGEQRYSIVSTTYLPAASVETIVFSHMGYKIEAIKAMREVFDLQLKEAKEVVEKATPVVLALVERWTGKDATMRATLDHSGQSVRIPVRVRDLVSSTHADVEAGENTAILRVPLEDLELV